MEQPYQRLSNFKICHSTYYPKRPNSGEKPRNKKCIIEIDQSIFSKVPLIDYSKTFQLKQGLLSKRPTSVKILKKIKWVGISSEKKLLIEKSAYKLPIRSNNSILKKSSIKVSKSDPLKKKEIVKSLKQSLEKLSTNSIFHKPKAT